MTGRHEREQIVRHPVASIDNLRELRAEIIRDLAISDARRIVDRERWDQERVILRRQLADVDVELGERETGFDSWARGLPLSPDGEPFARAVEADAADPVGVGSRAADRPVDETGASR